MAVSDQFRASVPDDAGEPDAANGGDRKRKDDAPETADGGGEESATPPAPESAPAPTRRRSRKSAEDTETQLKRLEQAGFSRAEAARLIFERMRPREEGLART